MSKIGIDPDKYWLNTLQENMFIAQAFDYKQEMEWFRTRQIEFANFRTTFNVGNGKSTFPTLKQPSDLYKLGKENETQVLEGKAGADFIKNMFKKNK